MTFPKYSFFLATLYTASSWACDCKPNDALSKEVFQYEAIFKGTVTVRHEKYHEVKVDEPFKGVRKGETLKINYNPNFMCDLDLEPKSQYVLFLNRSAVDEDHVPGTWKASLCTPSAVMKNAGATLKELRTIFRKKSSKGPE